MGTDIRLESIHPKKAAISQVDAMTRPVDMGYKWWDLRGRDETMPKLYFANTLKSNLPATETNTDPHRTSSSRERLSVSDIPDGAPIT